MQTSQRFLMWKTDIKKCSEIKTFKEEDVASATLEVINNIQAKIQIYQSMICALSFWMMIIIFTTQLIK